MPLVEQVKSRARDTNNHALTIVYEHASEALPFVDSHVNLTHDSLHLVSTSSGLNVEALSPALLKNLVNLKKLNDTRYANKFLEAVNAKLETEGLYIGCFESKEQRKQRIFGKFPYLPAVLFYYGLDFLWKRVIPKTPYLCHLYYALTKGNNRVFSTSEVLGRLISCGFEICEFTEAGELTYFAARKKGAPEFNENPTYHAIVTLKRVGKGGQYFNFYKFRTMYPYSEYLQNFVYRKNGTSNGDKFDEDFRITYWGRFLRRYWLDELPMLINWARGDLKLVGVRPLSRQKFETYPDWLKEKRTKCKPGLIPPYYADMPETPEAFYETESNYLDAYTRAPVKTDVRYFFKALYNILFKGARSK